MEAAVVNNPAKSASLPTAGDPSVMLDPTLVSKSGAVFLMFVTLTSSFQISWELVGRFAAGETPLTLFTIICGRINEIRFR